MDRHAVLAMFIGAILPCALLSAQQPDKLSGKPANELEAIRRENALLKLNLDLVLEKVRAPTPVPRLAIVLKDRHGHVTPERTYPARTGGGNIDIAQPRDDTVIITMMGVATAGPHPCKATNAVLDFNLEQCFAIVADGGKSKKGRLIMEAVVIGLLRGDPHGGSAGVGPAGAAVTFGPVSILGVVFEGHGVAGGENLAINDHKGPGSVPVEPGEYHLMQSFQISAAHVRSVCGTAAAAEFAPDPALDPLWISYTDPFHGASKKEFGFRVSLRVEPE